MKTRVKISELAQDLDLTLSDIELRTGINYNTLVRYNRGDTQFVRLDWLRKLQRILKCQSIESMLEEVSDDWKNENARICKSAIRRFWDKVEKTETCWLWKGCDQYFYARKDRPFRPRRYVFNALGKPLQGSKEVFVNCSNENCINPAHLLVVEREHHARIARSGRQYSTKYSNDFLSRIKDLSNEYCLYEGCEIRLRDTKIRRFALCPYHSGLVRNSTRACYAHWDMVTSINEEKTLSQ
jgi:DNA-binding Xre family transcriptional regulator